MAAIKGTNGNDWLVGTSTDDTFIGSNGADYISDGGGNDVLLGNAGNDVLSGGSGSDTFAFAIPYSSTNSADVITDFEVGVDVLHFDKFGWQSASMNDLALSQVGSDTVISYGYGETVTLSGVTLSQLMAHATHDFLFS